MSSLPFAFSQDSAAQVGREGIQYELMKGERGLRGPPGMTVRGPPGQSTLLSAREHFVARPSHQ